MAMLPARRSSGQNLVVNPTREFEDIYDRMGQLMNLAFGGFAPFAAADLPWAPPADVTETNEAYVVHVELPGVRKDQVDVQLQDRALIISGEIPEQSEDDGHRQQSSRRTGRFEYRTILPGDVKADAVSAQLSDGVLTVTVPKSEAAKPRKIEITG
jgi:HSP20 family protein